MISKKYFLTFILILTIFYSHSSTIQDSILNNTISKVIINKININGNKKTKKNIITRELSFREGQEFDKEKILSMINEDERKIINTNLFNEVNIYIRLIDFDNSKSQKVDIDIDVIESFYWIPSVLFELSDRNFNDWWQNFDHDLNRINYGLGLTQYNLTGKSDEFELKFRLGFIKEFYVSYYIPYLSKKQKGGLKFNVNYINYDHLEFNTENYICLLYTSDAADE